MNQFTSQTKVELLKRGVILWAALSIVGGAVNAQTPAVQTSPAPKGDLSLWESRFLGKAYDGDPIDKRIQRLELLLFGSTQEGTLSERLDQLRSAISSRALPRPSAASTVDNLNLLEQKILKKTFPSEKADERLARLEQKLFGKPSPAMPVADRIDRLKKTIGVGEPPPIAQFPSNQPYMRQFDGGIQMPFGDQMGGSGDLNREMNDMFRQLNQQLRQLQQRGGGQYTVPYSAPFQVAPNGNRGNVRPFEVPRGNGNGSMGRSGDDTTLPPYLDPNSI